MSTQPPRVRFHLGGEPLEGPVAGEIPKPTFNATDRKQLKVDVEGRGIYRVLSEDAEFL